MKYIQIESDKWEDVNRTYLVLEYNRPDPTSSRVDLVLEKEDRIRTERTVPISEIKWIFNY